MAWNDYQELVNSYNRAIRILRVRTPGETAQQIADRRALKCEYKKALRTHAARIRNEVELRLEDMEDDIAAEVARA